MKRKYTIKQTNRSTFHPEVMKVMFILLYGHGSQDFCQNMPLSVDTIIRNVELFDDASGIEPAYYAIDPRIIGTVHLFQKNGVRFASMRRLIKLLDTKFNTDIADTGFEVRSLTGFVKLYNTILNDLRNQGVL